MGDPGSIPLEKEMVTHSSTLAWKILWTKEPGRLQSMVSQRVGHDWATSLRFTSFVQRKAYNIQKSEAGKICLKYTYMYVCVYILKTEIWLKKSTKTKDPGEKRKKSYEQGPQEEPWIPDYHMKSSNWENTKC